MGSKNHEISISKNEFILAFDSASRAMGVPLPSAAAVVQYLLFKKLRGMVLLSGEGGDELFGGRTLPFIASRIARAKLIHKLPYGIQRLTRSLATRLKRPHLTARYEEYGMDRTIGSSHVFLAPQRVDVLYDTGLVRPGIRSNVLTPFYQELDSDPLNEILHVLQRGWLVEDALARSDRMSNRFDVDVRYPMLTPEVIQFAAGLSGPAKVRREGLEYVGKWPLRTLLREKLPKDLIHRPKRTMLDPLNTWLLTEGKTFLHRQIEGICDDLPHVFVRSTVRQLYEEQMQRKQNHGLKLWTLMHFYRWWKQTFSEG
jgi:asparagine synthase (glutamine-hydrolysing)